MTIMKIKARKARPATKDLSLRYIGLMMFYTQGTKLEDRHWSSI